jgi:CO/xanthine dehydrogenase Mo-binding subunit
MLPEMIERAKEMSGYEEKRKAFSRQDPAGRFRRGMGISLAFHGCGFTGSGERDHIKAGAKLKKNADDTVEILVSNSDMGQGVETTFSKIVAQGSPARARDDPQSRHRGCRIPGRPWHAGAL